MEIMFCFVFFLNIEQACRYYIFRVFVEFGISWECSQWSLHRRYSDILMLIGFKTFLYLKKIVSLVVIFFYCFMSLVLLAYTPWTQDIN